MEITLERLPEVPVRPKTEAIYIVVRHQCSNDMIIPHGRLNVLHDREWVMTIEPRGDSTYFITCYAEACHELDIDPVEYIFNTLKGWEYPG